MKVWILEMFKDIDEAKEQQATMEKMLEQEGLPDEQLKTLHTIIENGQKQIDENPNGWWYGIEGKTIYGQFCRCAKEAIRRHGNDNAKFRVVEGKIADDAETWLGYEVVKVNEGVLSYLYATV